MGQNITGAQAGTLASPEFGTFNVLQQGKTAATSKGPISDRLAGFLGSLDPVLIGPMQARISQKEALQEGQIRSQQTQQRIAAAQQSINRNKQLDQVLSNANAQAASRGISSASGSFKAIQDKSIEQGITADRIGKMNLNFKEEALRNKMQATQLNATAERFQSLLDVGKIVGEAFSFF